MQHLCSMNTACRHYFQKPPDRTVHLSNLYSATKTELAYGGVLCSAFSQLPVSTLRAAIYTSPIAPLSRASHKAISSRALCRFCLKLGYNYTTWVPS